jgi:hypothetical protein
LTNYSVYANVVTMSNKLRSPEFPRGLVATTLVAALAASALGAMNEIDDREARNAERAELSQGEGNKSFK